MNAKNHKQNTNFQIVYFLVGSCHTPDGAYALLCELREERLLATNSYEVPINARRYRVQENSVRHRKSECSATEPGQPLSSGVNIIHCRHLAQASRRAKAPSQAVATRC